MRCGKTATLLMAPPIPDAEQITEEDIEKIDYALKIRADIPTRRMLVLEHVLNICEDPKSHIIYFGPSVLDADDGAQQRRTPFGGPEQG